MPKWITISQNQHADKHYLPSQNYSFAADHQVVPILLAELLKLLPLYPLAFIQQDSTYTPVALTGIGSGQNLYLNHDGKWLAPYVPAFLRSYPFRVLPSNDNEVLCIHEDHLADDSQGKPLFDSEGNLSKPVQDTFNFLDECQKNRKIIQSACAALDTAGVIEQWPLQIKQGEGKEPLKVDGLFRISEKALNGLEAETFAGLRSHGAMPLTYAQLFSMNQIEKLAELAKYHAKQQEEQQQPDIEQLFGDDETLHFDNF